MENLLCTRCKKNIASVFFTRMEGKKPVEDRICFKCARELGMSQVGEMMQKMGLTDEDLENMSAEMMAAMEGNLPMMADDDNDEEDRSSNTATFPFLDKLFGSMRGGDDGVEQPRKTTVKESAPEKKRKYKFLDTYCVSLNDKASEGRMDRLVGREEEILRVIQILNRRQKNNPVLIGEPGVGKTAIAEGLAAKIVEGNVPPKLLSKEVWQLDLTACIAGTQFRGQFESRMKGLIDEVKKLGNIILVIDEVHNLVGAGDAEGSMNAANILKPALSRGEVQVIGATTFNEYRKYIEKDSALERRFQPVTVNEPSVDETVAILKGIRGYYEMYHNVTISDHVARQAVLLSERYITDRYLPDKAIDLLDEAGSFVNLENKDLLRKEAFEREINDIRRKRDEEMLNEDGEERFKALADLKSKELRLQTRLAELGDCSKPVEVEHLAKVIELWTKIPASKITETEFIRLNELENRLKSKIIGQDEAVAAVAAAIRRGRAGISPKRKPISFLFAGPTGVGKTELVRRLAMDLFDQPEALIRLDMSEFMEKHAVSRIIGAPPGYVGYDEAGQLTEKIRRKPYSVVLFDEIEKAHPDVMNILLQILDDGRITDAQGRKVSFENTVIVMTTNAGSTRSSGAVGFGRTQNEQNRERLMKALEDFLRPEFINRIDEIITFNTLTKENFKDIANLMLTEMQEALSERGIKLNFNEEVTAYLAEKSFSGKFGARNLRRFIQKEVEDKAAARIIAAANRPVSALKVSVDSSGIIVTEED